MQPPLTPSAPDEPLYEAFYGLREQPFALTTDPRFLFIGEAHRRAYEELVAGLRRREGLLLLTGETGMGKTTLCRAVIEALGPRTFSALILNPYMSDVEVLRVILRDFGLVTREEIRRGAFAQADVPQLLDTLEGFLRSVVALDSYAVVVIDEAQSLSSKVLDQIRVLGSLELDGRRLLQIVLVGQPELLLTIQTPALRALDERVSRRAMLGPLPAAEIEGYIRHRLTVAGGQDALEFTPESVGLIAELTRRVPRRINLLCDRTLEMGRIEGTTRITPEIVRRAQKTMAGHPAPALARPVRPEPPPSAPSTPDLEELALNPPGEVEVGEATAVDGDATPMFGRTPARAGGPGRRLVMGLLALLVVIFGAGVYTGWTYMNSDVGLPPLPQAPVRDLGTVPGAFPRPTEAEERYLMQELQRLNPWWRPSGG